MTTASALTKHAQIRIARRSPAYWRVTIDNPPINVMGAEMAGRLAIRAGRVIGEQTLPDYTAVAHRGRVTRARMSQIMKLLNLAPDLQEQILFMPELPHLNERNLRPIVRLIDWHEQRRLFQTLTFGSAQHSAVAGARSTRR